MPATRFILIGGFLGAGKTTTIARLAGMYQSRGATVGIVTNDQASDLVDTHSLRAAGFDVEEVAGSCFCCDFDALMGSAGRLVAEEPPDVILAEPVGSCTDVVATVVRPLQKLFGTEFDVAPYGVILKPSHGYPILRGDAAPGFSSDTAYVFHKQLEEADFVILNRVDDMRARVGELAGMVASRLPDTPLVPVSARTGEGFDRLIELLDPRTLDSPVGPGERIVDIDYERYARGEADLGWLNADLAVESAAMFPLEGLCLRIMAEIERRLTVLGAEPAHVKAVGMADGHHVVANLESSGGPAEVSVGSKHRSRRARVLVNARVATAPDALERCVMEAVDHACAEWGASAAVDAVQSLSPARPVPTHRLEATD